MDIYFLLQRAEHVGFLWTNKAQDPRYSGKGSVHLYRKCATAFSNYSSTWGKFLLPHNLFLFFFNSLPGSLSQFSRWIVRQDLRETAIYTRFTLTPCRCAPGQECVTSALVVFLYFPHLVTFDANNIWDSKKIINLLSQIKALIES